MTKEELEKEAEKFLGGWLIDPEIVKLLVDFAESREKRIADLEAQIEKMKCCSNCEWRAKDVCNGNNTCVLKEWKFDEGRR